jgi:succinate dehydrogenase / fumarate reductase cytochrome b subunit
MYRSTGFISFVLRRFTGVILVLYLILHIWVIGGINSGDSTFNDRMEFLDSPLFRLAEIGLLAAVVYHGFDGIRLLMVHYFNVTEYRKSLFYAAFVVSVILTIAGGLPILLYALEG